jgi:hypothetical protein
MGRHAFSFGLTSRDVGFARDGAACYALGMRTRCTKEFLTSVAAMRAEGQSLDKVAGQLGVTRERVRQYMAIYKRLYADAD